MKRPEGFDPAPPPTPQRGRVPRERSARPEPKQRSERTSSSAPRPAPGRSAADDGEPRAARRPLRVDRITATTRSGAAGRAPEADARAEARRAARERRKTEKAEVRRFTRRARNRRVALAAVGGTVLMLAGLVLTAVFSPILALRDIQVVGAARVSAEEVVAAVDGQLGTPLALLDTGAIERELGAFPLIRSYSIETLPPDTLVIHLVEREPVGLLPRLGGGFDLVDPAGVVLAQSTDRVAGMPLIDLAGADSSSAAFDAAVAVLLALPADLLASVDSVTAHTQDDVSFVLSGVGQRVTWGSAEDSARKAALLVALIRVTDPTLAGEFDVSAPSNGVFRPA